MASAFYNLDNRWLLPEGVAEQLPPQAWQLELLRRRVLDLYRSWGYEFIMPPLIEFLNSLLIETGDDLDLDTFKITDQLSGRLMGLRADITPQAARIDAHHMKTDQPVRLCYLGDVVHTRPDGYFNSRIPLQLGVELYGHGGIESDVEVLQLMLATLHTCGIKDPHIDLGHVGIYRGLTKQANLNAQQEAILFDALQRKARSEIGQLLDSFSIQDAMKQMLAALADLNGDIGVLEKAQAVLAGASESVRLALQDLVGIANAFKRSWADIPLHFDLAELRGYHYQTGVVFAAFVAGHGQEIARGGRYDEIGSVFGRARAATGFSADLKTLIALSAAPGSTTQSGAIWAPAVVDADLNAYVETLRSKGEIVIHELPGQVGAAQQRGCDRELRNTDGQWAIVSLQK